MTSCFKVLFRLPGIHILQGSSKNMTPPSNSTNCHGSQKELLYGDVGEDADHALPPYSSPENSGLQFNDDKLVSLDDARKCSLSVVILGPISFSQKFTSVISNRPVCPPQPFPHGRILFEPQPSSERRFYIDNELSIFVYLSIANKQGSDFQFHVDKPPIKVASENYVFLEIQVTEEGRQQDAAIRVFFKKDSENKHRLHAVSMDRFVIRKLVESVESDVSRFMGTKESSAE